MHCYQLRFTAPFHIDSRGDAFHARTETFIHSDTLTAALLSAWALLEPENIEQRAKQPPFQVSSALPFYKQHFFLPRAINTQAVKLEKHQLDQAKHYKKLQWLEIELWKQSFKPDWTKTVRTEQIKQGCLAFNNPDTKLDALWHEEERPRLAMDRITNSISDGQLFHLSRVWFNTKGGLYFLAKLDDGQQQAFEAALSLLSDSGIGADRSNGNGFFTWHETKETEMPNLSLAERGEMAVALSLVNPDVNDQSDGWLNGAAYKLISRGGWIGQSGVRKQRLRLFAEGSVFSSPLQGRVVNITPPNAPNPVYRDGRGFFISAG